MSQWIFDKCHSNSNELDQDMIQSVDFTNTAIDFGFHKGTEFLAICTPVSFSIINYKHRYFKMERTSASLFCAGR